jgi:GNAT superfamily N-acetyltransferase
LTTCPELSIGVFCTACPEQTKDWEIETLPPAKPVETDRADKAVSVMLAHGVATLCCGEVITDADMEYPSDWSTRGGKAANVGHQPTGRTVALHSLAVSPKLQGCGLGKMIMKAFIQQVKGSGLADRISLICQDVST